MTFPIVGIDASAGGLEAVSELLAALPSQSGVAFILVQHLDPDHESLLTELLAKRATMPVIQAQEGLAIEPGHVYVISPNTTLTVGDQRLHFLARPSAPSWHMPVDALLKSLATDRGDASIGVILSGADSDGALGIEAIKHEGGITFAQEPTHARFPSMPRSAIETGCVDFVLRPREIARELVRLVRHPYLRAVQPQLQAQSEESGEIVSAREEEQLRRVFRRLRAAHGADFTHYKRSTLRRRMARRMALQKIDDAAEYVALIERDPTEAATLYQDFLIRVTGFFRDPDSFESLQLRVFPSLSEGRSAKNPIRIWVPGCATGEEVYSIAMTLVEYRGERHMPEAIQIFGTDLSETAIEKARAGVYLDNIAGDLARATGALLHQAGRPLSYRQEHSRPLHLRAPGRDAGSALLTSRPRQLPQSPHLPGCERAAAGHADLPLRAAPAGVSHAGSVRERRAGIRPVRAHRQAPVDLYPQRHLARCGRRSGARHRDRL